MRAWHWRGLGAAGLLGALLAAVLAFRRPRQSVARGAQPPTEATAQPGDWLLTGTDRLGRPIRLVVPLHALARDDQGLVVGRRRQIADLVLGDPSVSRRHARIVRGAQGLGIIDLKSKRGTWVGGTRLEPYAAPTPVGAGSFVQFGTITLEVKQA